MVALFYVFSALWGFMCAVLAVHVPVAAAALASLAPFAVIFGYIVGRRHAR